MKNTVHRNTTCLLLTALTTVCVAGCQSQKASDKPGEDMNSAMSAQQKAVNAEHKKRGEQPDATK